MSMKQDMARARSLIQAKRYDDARALLITIDHPTADKWLAKINSIAASTPVSKGDKPSSFRYNIFLSIVLIFVFFVPGLIYTSIYAKRARQYPDVQGAQTMIFLNRVTFGMLAFIVAAGILFAISVVMSY